MLTGIDRYSKRGRTVGRHVHASIDRDPIIARVIVPAFQIRGTVFPKGTRSEFALRDEERLGSACWIGQRDVKRCRMAKVRAETRGGRIHPCC